jgi:hypothetical protein
MSSPALTKTRIALSALMATATLATSWLAGSLALAENKSDDSSTATGVTGNTTPATGSPTPTVQQSRDAGKKKQPGSQATFTPTRKATVTTAPSQTRTKGS